MHIYLGADHRGFATKNQLITWLNNRQIPYTDFGAHEYDAADDYNDFAKQVATAMLQSSDSQPFGILLCGSAQGMAMQANRFKGIRAAICYNQSAAIEARSHNDANIACIPADSPEISAPDIVNIFINSAALTDAKYQLRNQKLDEV